mgnify:CR=1 FL=1
MQAKASIHPCGAGICSAHRSAEGFCHTLGRMVGVGDLGKTRRNFLVAEIDVEGLVVEVNGDDVAIG